MSSHSLMMICTLRTSGVLGVELDEIQYERLERSHHQARCSFYKAVYLCSVKTNTVLHRCLLFNQEGMRSVTK